MIDTHCHLFWDQFKDDLPEVMKRARDAGVDRAITIAIDKPTAIQCLDLVADYPNQLKCAIGVHPSEVDLFLVSLFPVLHATREFGVRRY